MKRILNALEGDGGAALAQTYLEAARARGLAPDEGAVQLAAVLSAAYPALVSQITTRPEDVIALARGKLRIARDLRTYRRLVQADVPDPSDLEVVRRGLRRFAQRERLRIGARELLVHQGADLDTTSREVSDLAQVCIEVALREASLWAEARFGTPCTTAGAAAGARCEFVVLGMGKLGGRELNVGSDIDLLPFYETDDGEVRKDGVPVEQTLHEHFARITQRFTATLEEPTDDGFCWRVDLRLRPEGSRGPLVNALAAAERYYETWGRPWERAALVRARPVAGDLDLGARILDALGPFVWRKAVDPRISHEMSSLVLRARAEISSDPDRDLKHGTGGIREAEFFVQSLQLIWGGKEPRIRHPNTLEALRRLLSRGLVTDREARDLETAYLELRRVEHRIQLSTGLQTHVLPVGERLEGIARSLGHASGHELEKHLEKTRRKVAARFASLTRAIEPSGASSRAARLEPLFAALDEGEEAIVLTALAEGIGGLDFSPSASPDLARHLVALARRPDLPLGASTRDRYPDFAPDLLAALADAADPEQATRFLASFFSRFAAPSVYSRAMAEDRQLLRKVVGLFGASSFLGEALVSRPELMDAVLFIRSAPTPASAALRVREEIEAAERAAAVHPDTIDPDDAFVGALRRAKARVIIEAGLAELSGELTTRGAGLVLTAVADATLEAATRRALEERGLSGGLAVVGMGKLGGREIGYGSDLDIFFVYEPKDDDDSAAERYVRAAQRVLRLVSTPHGEGPGYELDTRLRPSGSHGLLVVSLEAFARYHGVTADGAGLPAGERRGSAHPGPTSKEAHDWERQALVKARPCAGDAELGARVLRVATTIAYERGAPPPEEMGRLRMRMERELAREGATRFDLKLGYGGIVDVEFAAQWLQMRHGADPRVRTQDTETALAALEASGHLDAQHASILREGYAFLRRLEQALRFVHGTSASLIEQGAPGLPALARRLGIRDVTAGAAPQAAAQALLARYAAVTRDVRAAYLAILGLPPTQGSAMTSVEPPGQV